MALDKSDPITQFYMIACDLVDDEGRIPVSIYLRSGHIAFGYVFHVAGTVMLSLSESEHGYTPKWDIPFREIVAIRMEKLPKTIIEEDLPAPVV